MFNQDTIAEKESKRWLSIFSTLYTDADPGSLHSMKRLPLEVRFLSLKRFLTSTESDGLAGRLMQDKEDGKLYNLRSFLV